MNELIKKLIVGLQETHPIVFQKREIKHKTEIGVARTVSKNFLIVVLEDCYFINSYNGIISGITWIPEIEICSISENLLRLSFRRRIKLDKTVDGWEIKQLNKRSNRFSKILLKQRGWQFNY